MPVARMLEPQNFMRPSENAASTLTTMVIATTHTVTITVFLKKIRKSVWVNRILNWSSVTPLAMIQGLVAMCATSASLLSAVTIM